MERLSRKQRRLAGVVVGFAVALVLGGLPAKQAAALSCGGEHVYMLDPVVELIDGPGDPLEEQMWWSDQSEAYGASH